MAKERIVSAERHREDDRTAAPSLRPRRLGEFVGQSELIQKFEIALEAARVLLEGYQGGGGG